MKQDIPTHPVDGIVKEARNLPWEAVVAAHTAAEATEQFRVAAHELFLTDPAEGEVALQTAPKLGDRTDENPQPICR